MFTLLRFDDACEVLSFQEERDIAWCVANPDICFNVCRPLLLEGALDEAMLARAVMCVAEVHDGLRTRFTKGEGGWRRIVEPSVPFRFDLHDARETGIDDERVQETLREFTEARFAPEAFPLFRVLLVRLPHSRNLLVLSMAHFIADAASGKVFFDDLARAYAMLGRGEGESLPAPDYRLTDFVRSHRSWMQGEDYASRLAAMRDRLLPGLRAVSADLDACGTSRQKARRATVVEHHFERDTYLALHEVAKLCKVTLPVALQAIAMLALARLFGQRRFFASFMFSNRHHAGMASLIGHLANALPLFVDLETPRTVGDFIAGTNKDVFLMTSGAGCVPLGAVNQAVAGLDPMLSLKSPFNAAMVNIVAPVSAEFADLKVIRHGLHYHGYMSNDIQLNFVDSGTAAVLLCRVPAGDPAGLAARTPAALADAIMFAVSGGDRPLSQW